MKSVLIVLAAAVLSFGIAFLLAKRILRNSPEKRRALKTILLTAAFGVGLMLAAVLCYMSIYYPAGEKAIAALSGNDSVKVQKIDGGYLFDGPGSDKALVFYPGAKVEYTSYAPLMLKLSENGFDCVLAKMPLNFAFFGMNSADRFVNAYPYDNWVIGGHSLGGVAACNYAEKHADKIDGIILLASYPANTVDRNIRLISIFGSEDGCLDAEAYEKSKSLWPENARELVIEGGNHAGFGDYGPQKGDGTATVTPEEQQSITAEAIRAFFSE